MKSPLSEARARFARYWFADGLVEIGMGILLVLQVGTVAVVSVRWYSPWHLLVDLVPVLLLGLFALSFRPILGAIRNRITYARVGYVIPRPPPASYRGFVVAAAAGGACIVALVVSEIRDPRGYLHLTRWIPALMGICWGAMCIGMGSIAQLSRLRLVGVVAMVLGLSISLARPALAFGLSAYLGSVALVMLVSGAVTLWRFLHVEIPPSGAS